MGQTTNTPAGTTPSEGDKQGGTNKQSSVIADLQAKIQALTAERDEAVKKADTSATELEETKAALQLSEEAAKTAEAEHAELSTLRSKEGLLLDAGLPRTLAANLVGETEDDWKASVETFTSLRGESKDTTPEKKPDPAQSSDLNNTTPTEDAVAKAFFGL